MITDILIIKIWMEPLIALKKKLKSEKYYIIEKKLKKKTQKQIKKYYIRLARTRAEQRWSSTVEGGRRRWSSELGEAGRTWGRERERECASERELKR